MFDLIRKVITGKQHGKAEAEDHEIKTNIASCVLMLEAAHVDDHCAAAEMEHIIATLKASFDLSCECVDELIGLAHIERKNAVDLWQFTNHINQQFTLTEKIAVMEAIWRIIHVDGELEKHEDHFAHKIANLLRLSHGQLIDAKIKSRCQLAHE